MAFFNYAVDISPVNFEVGYYWLGSPVMNNWFWIFTHNLMRAPSVSRGFRVHVLRKCVEDDFLTLYNGNNDSDQWGSQARSRSVRCVSHFLCSFLWNWPVTANSWWLWGASAPGFPPSVWYWSCLRLAWEPQPSAQRGNCVSQLSSVWGSVSDRKICL